MDSSKTVTFFDLLPSDLQVKISYLLSYDQFSLASTGVESFSKLWEDPNYWSLRAVLIDGYDSVDQYQKELEVKIYPYVDPSSRNPTEDYQRLLSYSDRMTIYEHLTDQTGEYNFNQGLGLNDAEMVGFESWEDFKNYQLSYILTTNRFKVGKIIRIINDRIY